MSSRFDKPFFLGFDELERAIASASKAGTDNYPPYDVIEYGDGTVGITIAVAGFGEADLNITVEGDQLIIAGRKQNERENENDDGPSAAFLYKGISARQFKRRFLLGKGMEVQSATLRNGLLALKLKQRVIEPDAIEIKIARG